MFLRFLFFIYSIVMNIICPFRSSVNCQYGTYIYIYIYVSKLATIVEGYLKAPFSIATILRCWRVWYSFLWIAPLTPYLCLIMMIVKQDGHQVPFFVYGMTRSRIEPRFLGPLANTLPTTSMNWLYIYTYIYIYIYMCVCACMWVYIYIYIYRKNQKTSLWIIGQVKE